jgi:short-subunit dehydrogenase
MNIEGRKVLLTGASSGIGRVIAKALHDRGASLIVTARRKELLDELCAELGERAEPVVADLTSTEDITRLAESARDVDIVVLNASLPASGRLEEFASDEIDRGIDANLRAPIQLTRVLVPRMMERGEGHLVFVSSLLGKMTRPGSSVYCATKFGLRGFALALSDDLHPKGVGVTTVLPGFIGDVGMFAETGVSPPGGMGTSTAQEVADAVVRGIEEGEPEIVVAPRKLRMGAFLLSIAPKRMAKVRRKPETYEYADAVAKAQASKR